MSFLRLSPTDLVVSNDAVTAPAWFNGNPTLAGANMWTASLANASPAPTFYADVYFRSGANTSIYPQFSIAYGQISGSGAPYFNSLVPSASATRTIYSQYRNLMYADENTSFNFGTGNTAAEDIFVINVNRFSYRESLFPGTFNLNLNGRLLTDNSNEITTVNYLDCGRVYDIVSGSNGTTFAGAPSTATTGKLGFYLPDVGVIILNPKALIGAGIIASFTPLGNTNEQNYQRIYSALVAGSFTLNSYETVSSDYVFVRVPNNEFNYTTNPSIVSGSGALLFPTLINNPQSYMTTVGLYNDNQELLAVAKLSKPLVKDFTKEALIQVKLNW
jgi:hypothetical protein